MDLESAPPEGKTKSISILKIVLPSAVLLLLSFAIIGVVLTNQELSASVTLTTGSSANSGTARATGSGPDQVSAMDLLSRGPLASVASAFTKHTVITIGSLIFVVTAVIAVIVVLLVLKKQQPQKEDQVAKAEDETTSPEPSFFQKPLHVFLTVVLVLVVVAIIGGGGFLATKTVQYCSKPSIPPGMQADIADIVRLYSEMANHIGLEHAAVAGRTWEAAHPPQPLENVLFADIVKENLLKLQFKKMDVSVADMNIILIGLSGILPEDVRGLAPFILCPYDTDVIETDFNADPAGPLNDRRLWAYRVDWPFFGGSSAAEISSMERCSFLKLEGLRSGA